MKICDILSVSPNAEIMIVNGELCLCEPEPNITYKFKVGDKVSLSIPPYGTYEIKGITKGIPTPRYKLSNEGNQSYHEDVLTIAKSQEITENIKTFEDACEWCNERGYDVYTSAYNVCVEDMGNDDRVKDIITYLKLRIITAALNEGWEPSAEKPEQVYTVVYDWNDNKFYPDWYRNQPPVTRKLAFKSFTLAEYAAIQFRDLYADFFCCKKR